MCYKCTGCYNVLQMYRVLKCVTNVQGVIMCYKCTGCYNLLQMYRVL